MKKRKLGDTGIQVSEIALGCWGFAGGQMWGDQQEKDSASTVAAALDVGINLMDTAEAYGDGISEEVLGRALGNRRHEAVIASKFRPGYGSSKGIEEACDRTLKRLQTDYLDLYQPHWPDRNMPYEETIQALIHLKETGKIRAISLSNYGVEDLTSILSYGKVASNQLPYSLLWRAIEYTLQPLCVEKDVGILCYSSLLHGLLNGRYFSADDVPPGRARTRHFSSRRPLVRHGEAGCEEAVFEAIDQIRQIAAGLGQPMALVAVAWLLSRPGVTSVITGGRRPEQIQQLARASELVLDEASLENLDRVTNPVKEKLGSNPDMWMSESRFR